MLIPGWASTKKGGFFGILPICCVLKEWNTNFLRLRLLSRGCCTGRSCSRSLRYAQVARGGRLGNLVDHQFQSRPGSSGVKEDRFVDRAIFLFEAVVICQHVDRVAVLLGVGVLELDLDGADLRRTALALHSELEIIARADAAKLIDFIMVPRNQRAHF